MTTASITLEEILATLAEMHAAVIDAPCSQRAISDTPAGHLPIPAWEKILAPLEIAGCTYSSPPSYNETPGSLREAISDRVSSLHYFATTSNREAASRVADATAKLATLRDRCVRYVTSQPARDQARKLRATLAALPRTAPEGMRYVLMNDRQAQWAGMAPSVAGGWIAVEQPRIDGLYVALVPASWDACVGPAMMGKVIAQWSATWDVDALQSALNILRPVAFVA